MGLPEPQHQSQGWLAELQLGFVQRQGRSVLQHRLHKGPLMVQRPFYPEGEGCCHVYLLHPPGGVVGGDRLDLKADVGAGAHALITVPAAGKFYRSGGATAWQQQNLHVAKDALLEWLPQETIVFDGARLDSLTRVDLDAGARFIGWEIVCLGRPAAQAWYEHGSLRQRFELWREGKPLFLERGHWRGEGEALSARWGLAGKPVMGTMLVSGHYAEHIEDLRTELQTLEGQFALSQMPEVLVCRYLGTDSYQAREGFIKIWQVLRPLLAGREACPPRIWNT